MPRLPLLIALIGLTASSVSASEGSRPAAPNFTQHVAPILYKNCASCHQPGEVAPFSLVGYDNARKRARQVADVAQSRKMPPWKAVEGHGDFVGVRRLSADDIHTLRQWADSGALKGPAGREPKPPAPRNGWTIGEPDLVLTHERPFKLGPEGSDVYRNFILKTSFPETRHIVAIDAKPGNKTVVHHVVVFLDNTGASHRLDGKDKDGQEGYNSLGGNVGFFPNGIPGIWAPGLEPKRCAPGTAFELKPGATLVMQVHYHRSGREETDQTRIGVHFSKEPVRQAAQVGMIVDPRLSIPAGETAKGWSYTFPIYFDQTWYWVMPHMHLLGKAMTAELELPDGTRKPLIRIDDWDFNWQMTYQYREPLKVPKGSKVHVSAVYDNSSSNPRNPSSPPRDVRWGEQTTDEMFVLVYSLTPGLAPPS